MKHFIIDGERQILDRSHLAPRTQSRAVIQDACIFTCVSKLMNPTLKELAIKIACTHAFAEHKMWSYHTDE